MIVVMFQPELYILATGKTIARLIINHTLFPTDQTVTKHSSLHLLHVHSLTWNMPATYGTLNQVKI